MKQCPACRTTYTDESLSFCLADGTPLDSGTDEQPTVVKKAQNVPLRIDIEPVVPNTVVTPHGEAPQNGSSVTWIKVLAAVALLGVLAIAALGLLGAVFYYGTGGKEKEIPAKIATPTPTAIPSLDPEKERLRDELANIQKKLEEQKRTNANTTPFSTNPDHEPDGTVTATVNSPGDGFLALRSMPDAERGERILRIPHGAEVEINNCEKTRVTISGRAGRWCQIEYADRTGWVFDAWLKY